MADRSDDQAHQEGLEATTRMNLDKEVYCWKSLRTILATMIPCCGCHWTSPLMEPNPIVSSTVIGTIFGHRKGRVTFCVQEHPGTPPFLLLEFATQTYTLIKEMKSGVLRITLECETGNKKESGPLFSEPIWNMYFNGRQVGFAIRKQNVENDSTINNFISLMHSVSTGAGVIPATEGQSEEEELIYMRATYERVVGSLDSEAFHMINPDETPGQELSIFLNRS